MIKMLLVCFALVLGSAAVIGCRAELEIDPDGSVSYNPAAPR